MIVCPTVRKQDIRSHYNLTTLFYRLLWGRHIHHGLWSGNESATVAQQQLTEARRAPKPAFAIMAKFSTSAAAWARRRFTWRHSSTAR